MQQLSEKTIEAVNILPNSSVNQVTLRSLETLRSACQKLETISTKELARTPLTDEEVNFIKEIVYGCGSGGFIGWYVDTIHEIAATANYTSLLDVPVIADVATFPPDDIEYPPQILHVGVGGVNALVVLFPLSNGTLVAAVGPVFSYYEFPLIGTKRLNDAEWKTMLTRGNRTEYLPSWVKDVYGLMEPYPATPENPTIIVLMVTTIIALALAPRIARKTRKPAK
jgi:hypothetical protein